MNLLTRTDFKKLVFARDKDTCVFCEKPAVDAHHIIERRIFGNGGYYLNNGVAVCEEHHLLCETTDISVEEIRKKCGIKIPCLPDHFYEDEIYDKWGNIILPNGTRLKGELFYDESVQKILANKLHLFTNFVKYPRTYHMPFSKGVSSDDKVIKSLDAFLNQRVILTRKMDGENTTIYHNHIHARSLDSKNHISRNWVKNFWATIRGDIPENLRICGENLFAKHSIEYKSLPSYFLGFSVWNDRNLCLGWDETQEWFQLLGIDSVEVLYDGIFDLNKIKEIYLNQNNEEHEGCVLRVADAFTYGEFHKKVAKMVRENHVVTTSHWMSQEIEKNGLKN